MASRSARGFAAVLMALGASAVLAHEPRDSAGSAPISREEYAWGRQGDPAKAARTIEVEMSDAMRFAPSRIAVKRGETVKFVVRNRGKLMHEMVIGTAEALARHAELMRKHPGMEHDEPYMAHVAPGRREVIAWTFTRAGEYMYGCLIPGHWEAGMKGTVAVAP